MTDQYVDTVGDLDDDFPTDGVGIAASERRDVELDLLAPQRNGLLLEDALQRRLRLVENLASEEGRPPNQVGACIEQIRSGTTQSNQPATTREANHE